MTTGDASDELYKKLKDMEGVVGSGVGRRNNTDVIIIYLSKMTRSLLARIPKEFKGKPVETEETGNFSFH